MPHASWLELILTVLAFGGLTCASLTYWVAKSNYHHKLRKGVRPLRLFMIYSVWDFTKVPLFIHTWIMANAVWMITHAPPPPAPTQQSVGNVVSWIIVTIALVHQQLKSIRWRWKLESGDFDPTGTTKLPPEDQGPDPRPVDQVDAIRHDA